MRILALFFPALLFAYLPPMPNCLTSGPDQVEVFCSFDLLYWEGAERGLEYAFKNSSSQTDQQLTIYDMHPVWEPAFKLGLGGHLPHDNWDLGLNYTFFRSTSYGAAKHNFDLTGTPGPGLIASWISPGAFGGNGVGVRFSGATARWKLFTQLLDGMLSRSFLVGKELAITPGFGLRCAWIHQNYNLAYSGGNTISNALSSLEKVISSNIEMSNLSNNFGPLVSIASRWRLAEQWDLFGSLSGSILASHFHVIRKESDAYTNTMSGIEQDFVWLKRKYWAFCPQGQIALGVRFGDCVTTVHRSIYYSIGASYEAQIFWKQNQLLRYVDNFQDSPLSATVVPTQGDLILHGLTIDVHGDF